MTAYVLDASIAAKWVLPLRHEPLAAEAMRLLDRFIAGEIRFLVPDLFWPEIANVLWKSVRLGRTSGQSAREANKWIQALGIPTRPTAHLVGDALTLALDSDRTVYDSLYVALAIVAGRFFLTADEKLVNALGARLPVRWLRSSTV